MTPGHGGLVRRGSGAWPRARRAAALAAAVLVLPACHDRTTADVVTRHAYAVARARHASVGAAVALLLTLALRHVVDTRDERRGTKRPVLPSPTPGLLLAAILANEVAGMLLVALAGGFAGYALGTTAFLGLHPLRFEETALFYRILLGIPLFTVVALVGRQLVRVNAVLPMVPTKTFRRAAYGHAAAVVLGLSVMRSTTRSLTAFGIAGAALAGASAVGFTGCTAGVVVRARAKRRAKRARRAASRQGLRR